MPNYFSRSVSAAGRAGTAPGEFRTPTIDELTPSLGQVIESLRARHGEVRPNEAGFLESIEILIDRRVERSVVIGDQPVESAELAGTFLTK